MQRSDVPRGPNVGGTLVMPIPFDVEQPNLDRRVLGVTHATDYWINVSCGLSAIAELTVFTSRVLFLPPKQQCQNASQKSVPL